MVDSDLPPQLRRTWQINVDQLQIFMDMQQRPVTLGKGAYGTVYLGMLDGVRKVAVKIVDSPTQRHQQRFVQEIATLRACYDSNIVSFLGASVQEGRTLLVMEYMEGGNLWDNLQQDSQNGFRWYNRGHKIALDIAAGISFLHRNDIIHLDLKSPNVLLDENNKACIADIGLGKMMVDQDALASAATFLWAAPEQLQGLPVSKASDIFSLGVIVWEIVAGEQPVRRQYRELRVPHECPAEVATLITACLSINPAERPTINQVFKTLQDAPH
ncbi:hypothetical protein WJX74_002973 [Apatococcus lobatus]|uniref:Protein kinase domain-containing protein n=1 Tax=Apatococcus lobatus TaxID=904363 RepID=A0AAW1QLC5_9CHLO